MREHRIFGPPGTGKTTTLAAWIGRAAERYGGAVLCVSFTKAAAAELVGRDLPIDRDRVGTLHSFCHRALGRPPILEVTPTLLREWNEQAVPAWRVAGETGVDEVARPPADGVYGVYCWLRNRLAHRAGWDSRVKAFAEVFEPWLLEREAFDFTGLVEAVHHRQMPSPVRAAVLFADEAQDCTPLELAVLRMWGSACEHWVLSGDDQQAIYGFRGATPDAFLDPPLPQDQKTVLRQSWRLPENLRAYAYAYGSTMSRFEPKDYVGRAEGGEVLEAGMSCRDVRGVVDLIEAQPASFRVGVVASCDFLVSPLIGELKRRGIPFHNPYRKDHGGWNPMRGGVERLLAFLSLREQGATWAQVWPWLECIDATAAGLARGAKAQVEEIHKDKELAAARLTGGEFREVVGIDLPPSDPQWLVDHLLASREKLFEYALTVYRARGIAALVDEPKVIVGTIHSVKGGEAESIILCPDLSVAAIRERTYGPDGADAIKRLFYVGMTRARERLLLLRPSTQWHEKLPRPA